MGSRSSKIRGDSYEGSKMRKASGTKVPGKASPYRPRSQILSPILSIASHEKRIRSIERILLIAQGLASIRFGLLGLN